MSSSIGWIVAAGVLAGAAPAAALSGRANAPASHWGRADWVPLSLPAWVWTVLGATVGALLALRFADADSWPAYLVLAACAVPISAVDLATTRIPDRILAPAAGLTILCLALAAAVSDMPTALLRGALAAFLVGCGFLALAILAGGGFGLGDVKLLAYLALLTGFQSWSSVLRGLFAGFVIAALAGLVLRRVRGTRHVPLAPWLILGAACSLLH